MPVGNDSGGGDAGGGDRSGSFVLESPRPGAINTGPVERELCGVLVRTVAVARSTYELMGEDGGATN